MMNNVGFGWLRVSFLRVQFCANPSAADARTALLIAQQVFALRQASLSLLLPDCDRIRNMSHQALLHLRRAAEPPQGPRASDEARDALTPTSCHTFAWIPPVPWSVF